MEIANRCRLLLRNYAPRLMLIAMILAFAAFLSNGLGGDRAVALQGGDAEIQSVESNYCLDVEGASQQNLARIIQWPCNGQTNQTFHDDDPDDVDYLQSWNTNETKCIDVPNGSISDGTGLIQYTCQHSDNQGFWVLLFGNHYLIINERSGKCLDDPGSSHLYGVQMIQWTCHAARNQQWYFLGH